MLPVSQQGVRHMMKTSVLFIVALIFSASGYANDLKVVEKFAADLIDMIKVSDVMKFEKVRCLKIPCGNIGVEYIFGSNESSQSFKSIMSEKDISYKVFGPYTVEAEYVDSSYTIVFYSKSNSPFGPDGKINIELGFTELYRTFLQTQVTVVEGKVLFQRVPFYLESHHPYAGDYG